MKRYILSSISILIVFIFFVSPGLSAERICYEDFEAVTLGNIPEYDPTGSGEISRAGRAFYHLTQHFDDANPRGFVDVGGTHGKVARAEVGPYTGDQSYSEPKFRWDDTIGNGTEVYFKWDMRMGASLCSDNPTCDIEQREFYKYKLFKISPTDTAATGVRGATLNLMPNSQYSWYGWGGNEYYFTNADTKISNTIWGTDWHTFEVYIEIGSYVSTADNDFSVSNDTTVKLWIDRVLVLEDNHVPIRRTADFAGIRSVGFVRHVQAAGIYTLVGGNLDFDNLEVWDGIPPSNALPSPPSGLKIVD